MDEIYFAQRAGQEGMNIAEMITILSVSIGVILFFVFCSILFTTFED